MIEIYFQKTGRVSKVQETEKAIRNKEYKTIGQEVVRRVTVKVQTGESEYENSDVTFDHKSLQLGDEVRIVLTTNPAVTEQEIADAPTVQEINKG